MKLLFVFVIGIALGALVIAVSGQSFFPEYQNSAQQIAAPTNQCYEEKYVSCIIDQIQFVLMLQATCPELVPDWHETQIRNYAEEFAGPLRNTLLLTDALYMIEQYYSRNGHAFPTELKALLDEQRQEFNAVNVKTRLSLLDEYLVKRKISTSAANYGSGTLYDSQN